MTIINLFLTLCVSYSFATLGFDKPFSPNVNEIKSSFTNSKGRKNYNIKYTFDEIDPRILI